MARILFLNGGLEGHVNPTLEVVRELIRRGEEVVYLTTEPMRQRVEETGADVRTFDGARFSEVMRSGDIRHFVGVATGLLRTADVIIPRVLEETRGAPFDYVIHDTMLGCGRIVAQLLHLPAIASCTTFARSALDVERMLKDLSATLSYDEYERLIQDFHAVRDSVSQRYAVTVDSVYEAYCNPEPLALVYTSQYFQPDGEHCDDGFQFVGPTRKVPTTQTVELWETLSSPLIYISLGTVFNQAPDFYRLCFEALGDSPYQVLLSVGVKTVVEDLGMIPKNFLVRNYVPQLEVLGQAQLFITHGGMNSVNEGLLQGVPLVVLPQGADQFAVGDRIADMGAGVRLDYRRLPPTEFRGQVDRIMNNSAMRGVCREIGKSLQRAGGAARAVEEVFKFKTKMGIR